MYVDDGTFDDLFRKLLLLAFGFFVINAVLLTVATRWLSRLARRRGRRGHALPAFALVLAVEVALVTISRADPIDSTIVRWLALSVAVMALALPRLLAR